MMQFLLAWTLLQLKKLFNVKFPKVLDTDFQLTLKIKPFNYGCYTLHAAISLKPHIRGVFCFYNDE